MKILLAGTLIAIVPLSVPAVEKLAKNIDASAQRNSTGAQAPATLDSLLAPFSPVITGVSNLRSQMLTEAGKTVGFRGGMAARSGVIANSLQMRADSLDKMFQFSSLVNTNGIVPPVIVQARDVAAFSPDQVRTASHVYRIEREERFVSVPPSWRDYLFAGLPVNRKVDLPVVEARPQDGNETAVWQLAVRSGWDEGTRQADAILDANFNRLTRDYTGMLLYSSLLKQGMISRPRVAELAQTVTGDSKQIMIGDTLRRLTGRALFDTDYRNWQPAITYYPEPPGVADTVSMPDAR
ncbi:type IV secretory system conjugative DNA transfer family protein [Massilia atriviolacea]|uniref:type IV secretory system conjugative DNA transfer family protein n=1 Tax=Massilia atriviolacea TaxID=2495579 RepID=UPI001E4DE71B|nr:type IV secretory system conjugative DNA transfer family protein [Massilia atriviolacea]